MADRRRLSGRGATARRLAPFVAAALVPAGVATATAMAEAEAASGGPPAATAEAVPGASALAMRELAPGVWVHEGAQAEPDADNLGDVANIGFVIGGDCVAVIDGGASLAVGRALRAALRTRTALPVCHRIATHMHPDHVLGLAAFDGTGPQQRDPTMVGHARLAAALGQRSTGYRAAMQREIGAAGASPEPPLPGRTVDPQAPLLLALGEQTLHLQAHPPAHTDNDLSVWLPAAGVLWTGDLLFHQRVPALDGRLRGWQAWTGAQRARDCGVDGPHAAGGPQGAGASPHWIVPGHGPVLRHDGRPDSPWCTALGAQAAYLDGLAQTVRSALDAGLSLGDLLRREGAEGAPPAKDTSAKDTSAQGRSGQDRPARPATGTGGPGPAQASGAVGWALYALYHRRNLSAAWAELEWE
ncbi:MAG: hypothetical protein RLY78_2507 [Pseudomonadota bacterium]